MPAHDTPEAYDAFLLVSFGGPERAEDVMPFLRRVAAGRHIPDERLREVAEHYYLAGGASPINARCRELLAELGRELAGSGLALYWGNRNSEPFLARTITRMRDDGVSRALALVTSAYGGYSSCRQYLDDIASARAAVPGAPQVDKLRLYYNHPGWVGAWAASLRDALAEAARAEGAEGGSPPRQGHRGGGGLPPAVIFSAHSIPLPLARTSPYVEHVAEAARLVAEAAGVGEWELAWQSRSGNPASPWLGPDVVEVVKGSRAAHLVVVPIGFVCENLEVVHDLDVEAAAAAAGAGAGFTRAANVSGHPLFVKMVRQLIEERTQGAPPLASGAQGPWPAPCPAGHCPLPAPTQPEPPSRADPKELA